MFRPVDAHFSAAGEGEGGEASPSLFAHLGDWDVLRFEIAQGRGDVIAHQEKFVPGFLRRIVLL